MLAILQRVIFIALTYFFATSSLAEINGLIDVRTVYADDTRSWLYEGLGKQRFDNAHDGVKLGQAVLDLRANLADTITGKLVINGYDDRTGFVDITEAYVQWKPLPINGYRFKAKLGAFFPAVSLENGGVGWTNPWMLSTSAINNWVGEELRTIGTEFSWGRPGQLHNSPHDVEFISAFFTANDPATSLLAWRGWSLGDRITGLTESLPLPRLPSIYGASGIFDSQGNRDKPFTEIDHRYGYYVGANYGYNNWFSIRTLHYDNRGNPLGIYEGQWSWKTSFDHIAIKADLDNNYSILAQSMRGKTLWGVEDYGVNSAYKSWYFLVSKVVGKYRISTRYDHFTMEDNDHIPGDNNAEDGHAVALNVMYMINDANQTGIEYLKIFSHRAGREYLTDEFGKSAVGPAKNEVSIQIFYRYKF